MALRLSRIVYFINFSTGGIWPLYHVQIAHRKTCIFGFTLISRFSPRLMTLWARKTVLESLKSPNAPNSTKSLFFLCFSVTIRTENRNFRVKPKIHIFLWPIWARYNAQILPDVKFILYTILYNLTKGPCYPPVTLFQGETMSRLGNHGGSGQGGVARGRGCCRTGNWDFF